MTGKTFAAASALLAAVLVSGPQAVHAQTNFPGTLSAPAGGVRWGQDAFDNFVFGPCSGTSAVFAYLHDARLPMYLGDPATHVGRGVGVYPSPVPCNAGTYQVHFPVMPTWYSVFPGPLTVVGQVPGLPGGPDSYTNQVSTAVRFEHQFTIPELATGATIAGFDPIHSPCAALDARYMNPATSGVPPPPGLQSPQYVSVQTSGCTANTFATILAGLTLPIAAADGALWIHDPGSSGWRQVHATDSYTWLSGNDAVVPIYGDSGLIAFSYDVRAASVYPDQGMWWSGETESGWGLDIAVTGDNLFVTGFIYDQGGKPTWVVMPNGNWDLVHRAWTGAFFMPHSAPFGAYSGGALDMRATVGSGTLSFSGAGEATFTYLIEGYGNAKRLTRFLLDPRSSGSGPYEGIWWGGPGQAGWGLSIAQQGALVFATWYTYGADGEPTWFYSGGPASGDGKFTGTLYRTTGGPWLTVAQYNGGQTRSIPVGTLELSFKDNQSGTMTAVVDGAKTTNAIQRFGF